MSRRRRPRPGYNRVMKELAADSSWADQRKFEKVAAEAWRKKWGGRTALTGPAFLALFYQVAGYGPRLPQTIEQEEPMARKPGEKMQHELKIWPSFYEEVINGLKPWEIRKNDRDFQAGDTLLLREWQPSTELPVSEPMKGEYTGRQTIVDVLLVRSLTDIVMLSDYVIMTTRGHQLAPAVAAPEDFRDEQVRLKFLEDGVLILDWDLYEQALLGGNLLDLELPGDIKAEDLGLQKPFDLRCDKPAMPSVKVQVSSVEKNLVRNCWTIFIERLG